MCVIVRYSLFMCNTQRLSLVHAECPCSLAITVAFWPVLLAVARLAVNFIHVNSNSCAVQILPTHHCTDRHIHMHMYSMLLFCISVHMFFKRIHVFRSWLFPFLEQFYWRSMFSSKFLHRNVRLQSRNTNNSTQNSMNLHIFQVEPEKDFGISTHFF